MSATDEEQPQGELTRESSSACGRDTEPRAEDVEPLPGRESPSTSAWMAKLFPTGEERRSVPRYQVSARVQLTIFFPTTADLSDAGGRRLTKQAFTRDLSVNGSCLVLEESSPGLMLARLVGRNVKLRIRLNQLDERPLNLLGKIVWGRMQGDNAVLGVQFTEMPAADRVLLEQYCRSNEGEMSRLTNLWELLVADGEKP